MIDGAKSHETFRSFEKLRSSAACFYICFQVAMPFYVILFNEMAFLARSHACHDIINRMIGKTVWKLSNVSESPM